MPLDVIEHEKLGLGTEEGGVTDTGGLQVFLGATGNGPWVALVALHGARLDDVTAQDDGGVIGEGVQHCGAVVGHQDHV